MTARPASSVRWYLLAGAVVVLVALAVAWGIRSASLRAVLEHPVIADLDAQGWEVIEDRRFRASPLDQLFAGGFVEHPTQRRIVYAVGADEVAVVRDTVERAIFGEVDGDPLPAAYGLAWERTMGTDSARYVGVSNREAGRLSFVTVTLSAEVVEVRTFGN
jgi:hypothetical protein